MRSPYSQVLLCSARHGVRLPPYCDLTLPFESHSQLFLEKKVASRSESGARRRLGAGVHLALIHRCLAGNAPIAKCRLTDPPGNIPYQTLTCGSCRLLRSGADYSW